MKFLTNAPARKKRRKARFKKGSVAAKRYMSSIRPKSKGGVTVAKRRRKATRKRTTKRRVVRHRQNPPAMNTPRHRRRVRRHRRNPPRLGFGYFSFKTLMNGAIDGAEVVVGKSLVRTVPGMVGLPTSDNTGLLIQTISAVIVGWAGHTFGSPNMGKMFLAGGLAAPMETLIKQLNIPFISAGLGEDVVEIEGMSGYVQVTDQSGMSGYVQPSMGENEYDYSNQ